MDETIVISQQHSLAPAGARLFTYNKPFRFECGKTLDSLELAYEMFGDLNPQKNNVILIHHALSTDSHVCSQENNPQAGWWEAMVGPGKAIDTSRFCVICINNIGSCFGSSGPASINPKTGRAYRLDFPEITMEDIAQSQQLLLDYLGIRELYAVIGNSMGAMISLAHSVIFSSQVKRLLSVSSCYRAYPVSIAYHTVQKEIIQLDPAWQNGYYTDNPYEGLKTARKLGLVSYRDANDLNRRFTKNDQGDIRDYLEYNANKLAQRFDANCYLYLIDAMDRFDISKKYAQSLQAFQQVRAKTRIISVDSDILFPPSQQHELYEELKKAGADVDFVSLRSNFGHDAFYTDPHISAQIQEFLAK